MSENSIVRGIELSLDNLERKHVKVGPMQSNFAAA